VGLKDGNEVGDKKGFRETAILTFSVKEPGRKRQKPQVAVTV